jgi:hypothetical protein
MSSLTKPCPEGKERNPKTGRCVNIKKKTEKQKPCPEGKERNPKTGRCINIKQKTVKRKIPIIDIPKTEINTKQFIVNPKDTYMIDDKQMMFKYTMDNIIYRDNPIELEKNYKNTLENICKYCELDYKGLKKKELIKLIKDSNCFIYNK